MSARGNSRRSLEVIRLRASDAVRDLGCALQHLDQIDLGSKPSIESELEQAAQAFQDARNLLLETEKLCSQLKKDAS